MSPGRRPGEYNTKNSNDLTPLYEHPSPHGEGKVKSSSAKEVNGLLDELRKVDPEAAAKWDSYFKGVRESEAARLQKLNSSKETTGNATENDSSIFDRFFGMASG